jgi:rod shape determining protein RodA
MALEAVDARARGLRPRGSGSVDAVGLAAFLRRLDWVLIGAVVALVGYGLWALDGVTLHDASGSAVGRQAANAVAGGVIALIVIAIDPEVLRRFKRLLYGGTILVMLVVLLEGAATRGSKRWIDIGPFLFQPSEFGKVFLALALAAFLADRGKRIGEFRTMTAAVGLAAIPLFLVFIQPDIGTALVYAAVTAAALFLSGVRWSHLAILGGVLLTVSVLVLWVLPAAGTPVLKQYQKDRLTGFLHPDSDPRGTTYNISQSITTLGAGELRGRGVSGATQTSLNYLPEHRTDFVFASFGEQRGFLGLSVLLLLYLLVVWRGLKVITVARDLFGAIAAGAIVFMFLFQIFVNAGMTMGIAPITGIPLPFMSYGGSSMVTNLLAVGILVSIHARRRPAYRSARR